MPNDLDDRGRAVWRWVIAGGVVFNAGMTIAVALSLQQLQTERRAASALNHANQQQIMATQQVILANEQTLIEQTKPQETEPPRGR